MEDGDGFQAWWNKKWAIRDVGNVGEAMDVRSSFGTTEHFEMWRKSKQYLKIEFLLQVKRIATPLQEAAG
jgi:hypothetical protein